MNELVVSLIVAITLVSCSSNIKQKRHDYTNTDITSVIQAAEQQIGYQVKLIEESNRILIPRTVKHDHVQYASKRDWTSGFFAGTMFYIHDLTKDTKWIDYGVKYTENLDSIKYLKSLP